MQKHLKILSILLPYTCILLSQQAAAELTEITKPTESAFLDTKPKVQAKKQDLIKELIATNESSVKQEVQPALAKKKQEVPAAPQKPVQEAEKVEQLTTEYTPFSEAAQSSASKTESASSLWAQSQPFKPDSITLLTNESLKKYEKKKTFSARSGKVYVHPLPNGKLTSRFGYRRMGKRRQFHKGIDVAARRGTPVYAAGSGTVRVSGWLRGYGKVVYIDHGNGYQTRYAHNSRLLVRKGQRVRAGQVIAKVGSTGRSSGPHVHFEVRKNGRALNPYRFIR